MPARKMAGSKRALALASAALAAALVLVFFKAPTHSAPPPPRTPPAPPSVFLSGGSLYPAFSPARHAYVSRCPQRGEPITVHRAAGLAARIGSTPLRGNEVRAAERAGAGENLKISVRTRSASSVYRVRCLPAQFPRWSFQRLRGGPQGLFTVSTTPSRTGPGWVIAFDQDGTPRWWYRPQTLAYDAQVTADGALAWARGFGDGYGVDPRSAVEIRSPSGHLERLVRVPAYITDVHEFHEQPSGDVFLDSYVPESRVDLSAFGGPRRASVVLPRVTEIDPSGEVIWEWSSRGHIALSEARRWWNNNILSNPHPVAGAATYDAVHLNSIDPWGHDEVVVSARHTDAVYGIERSTGDIAWKLGGTRTPESLRVIGGPHPGLPFAGQHDARITGNVLSVFDNGTHRGIGPRAAFYRLDIPAGTATFISDLRDQKIRSSHCCGSVRQFGDGWLVDWGDNRWITGYDRHGRIAFRLHLPSSTYRAIPIPDGTVTNGDLNRGLEAMER